MNFLLQLSAIHDKIQAQIKYICVRILIKRVGDCMDNRELANQIKMNNAGQSADCPALRFYRDDLEWPSRALWPYSAEL